MKLCEYANNLFYMSSLRKEVAKKIVFDTISWSLSFNIAEFFPMDDVFTINIPCISNNKLTYIRLVSLLEVIGVFTKGKPLRKEMLKYDIPKILIKSK